MTTKQLLENATDALAVLGEANERAWAELGNALDLAQLRRRTVLQGHLEFEIAMLKLIQQDADKETERRNATSVAVIARIHTDLGYGTTNEPQTEVKSDG